MNRHHYVVIMAGGIGSRFWPMSRQRLPQAIPGYIEYRKDPDPMDLRSLRLLYSRREYLRRDFPGILHHRQRSAAPPAQGEYPRRAFKKEYGSLHCLYLVQAATERPPGLAHRRPRRSPGSSIKPRSPRFVSKPISFVNKHNGRFITLRVSSLPTPIRAMAISSMNSIR